MKVILAPTKKMRQDTDSLGWEGLPRFLPETGRLLETLRTMTAGQLQKLWGCSDAIAEQNIRRLEQMELEKELTPAILAYEGIAFQYMAPGVFTDQEFSWVREHLRILSGFYGVLEPMNGVRPYRLEMQAKLPVGEERDLYGFWGKKLYDAVRDGDGVILNLASKEYSRCIENYLTPSDRMITCFFGEEVRGKLVQKGTFAKMARGEMVRFLAERQAETPEVMQEFDRLDFRFCPEHSDDRVYTFLRAAGN